MTGAVLWLGAAFAAEDPLINVQAAFLKEEYSRVIEESDRLLTGGGSSQDLLLYLKGLSALKLQDLELARGALSRLTDEFPRSRFAPLAGLALGDSWRSSGEEEKALEIYQGLLADPQAKHLTPQVQLRLGLLQRRKGNWQEAKNSLERVVAESPEAPWASQAGEILKGDDFFFSVQVGAFATESNALKLMKELEYRGYAAAVTEAQTQGKRFHRVRVGRFTQRQEAEEEAQRLSTEGFPARVVP